MRNVTELSKLNGKVYVYLRNEVIERRFLQDAENEGFTFGDGEKPTARPGNNLHVVIGRSVMWDGLAIWHFNQRSVSVSRS